MYIYVYDAYPSSNVFPPPLLSRTPRLTRLCPPRPRLIPSWLQWQWESSKSLISSSSVTWTKLRYLSWKTTSYNINYITIFYTAAWTLSWHGWSGLLFEPVPQCCPCYRRPCKDFEGHCVFLLIKAAAAMILKNYTALYILMQPHEVWNWAHSVSLTVQVLAILFAALVHDFDHTGTNNAFLGEWLAVKLLYYSEESSRDHTEYVTFFNHSDTLVRTRDSLALLYNDRSILENHHIASAFALLTQEDLEFYCPESQQHWDEVC